MADELEKFKLKIATVSGTVPPVLARAIATKHRCAVDVSVHRPGRGGDTRNHHAHLLCTTRRLHGNGFQEKTRELDDMKTGEVVYWRERWAALTNERLKERGSAERVDHRSLQAQGVDRAPTVHKGPLLTAIERRGLRAHVAERLKRERSEDVQARLTRATELGRLERERAEVEKSILVLSTDIAAARRDRDQNARPNRKGFEKGTPTTERKLSLDQWREDVRRQREGAKEKTQERGRSRNRTKNKSRDGPDYER